MNSEALEMLLERLRAETGAMDPSSAERERMDALAAAILQRLQLPREDNQDADLVERVSKAIDDFELAHPRLTGVLNEVLVRLGSAGI